MACKLKAVYFLMALLRLLARHGQAPASAIQGPLRALHCLTWPIAHHKTLKTAIEEYDESMAGSNAVMSFIATLQYVEPSDLPTEISRDAVEVRLARRCLTH